MPKPKKKTNRKTKKKQTKQVVLGAHSLHGGKKEQKVVRKAKKEKPNPLRKRFYESPATERILDTAEYGREETELAAQWGMSVGTYRAFERAAAPAKKKKTKKKLTWQEEEQEFIKTMKGHGMDVDRIMREVKAGI